MIKEFGLWWKYSPGREDSAILISNEDFSQEQAEQLGRLLYSDCINALRKGTYKHTQVKVGDEDFYVIIDSGGSIKLPDLRNGKRGKTLDASLIPTFRK